MSKPTVSVIMNCLNGERYLREAIDSVFAQTFESWELIFWDNASTDGTAAIAKSYGPQLRYFCSESTVPLGHARNFAIRQARGEYLAFLDSDDLWFPSKLEQQVPLFANAKVGLVFSDTITFNAAGDQQQQFRWNKPPRGRLFAQMLNGSFVAQIPGIVIRRDVLDNLDEWFDETFNVVEETDLFTRIAHDWDFDYVDAPLAKYRLHKDSWTWNNQELLSQEMDVMVEKLCRVFPDCEAQYPDDIARLRARAQYHRALVDWQGGRSSAVRKRLRPHLTTDRRLFVPFVLSFLPYEVYMRIYLTLRIGSSLR